MLKWFRYLSIRTKLIWLVLAMFTIPWMGNQYIQEMKEFLLQGQKEALLLTAGGLAIILNERTDLFEQDTGIPEYLGGKNDSFAYQLPRLLQLDGDATDWGEPALRERLSYSKGKTKACDANYDVEDFELTHLMGYRGSWLYALFEVTDQSVVFRDLDRLSVGNSDHLRIVIQHPNETLSRYTLVARGPGRMSAYLVQNDWQSPLIGDPANNIVAVLKEIDGGYAIELRLPRYLVGQYSRLGFTLIDVDDQETRELKARISTYPLAENNEPGRVLLTSPELTSLLRGLNQPNSRIWILDDQQQVRAVVGGLSPLFAVDDERPELVTDFAKAKRYLSDKIDSVLKRPNVKFEDLASNVTVRRDDMILDVLAGSAKADTRRSVDNKVNIVMAGHPIRAGNSVLGAVVVEQSSNAILTRQYELLKSLAAASLLVFAFITGMLIIFAWRLTIRIGRLRDTTEQAITREGRVQERLIPNRHYPRDELGDLGRSITSMLRRLSGYTQYLEGLPDTLAHELNNPLNVVSSSLQNLEQKPGNLNDNKYMERAQAGVHRLRHILTSLTAAANLEEAMRSEDKERLDLANMLPDYVDGAKSIYPKHSFELQLDEGTMHVMGSAEHIAELLDKLIDNATQFGTANTPILVRLRRFKTRAVLSVVNEGPKINEGLLERIFEPMVSLGRKDAKQSHLGLGLYVVRLIAEFHQAHARMRNTTNGKGVVISVSFPAA